jgi:hypothetical protein
MSLMLKSNPGNRKTSRPQGNNMKRLIVAALMSGSVALAGFGLSMGTAQAFDPQPDPPGKSESSPRLNPGVIRGFNPQPEPPTGLAPTIQRG